MPEDNLTPKKRGPKPGTKRKPLKKRLEADPHVAELKASGKVQMEVPDGLSEPLAPSADQIEKEYRKKYPRAHKWPSRKFYKAIVNRGDGTVIDYAGMSRQQVIDYQYFNRVGLGSPVLVRLGSQAILPEEIVEAIKDTEVDYPSVLGDINEHTHGFSHMERRARFHVHILGPATPEDYEATVGSGKNREV